MAIAIAGLGLSTLSGVVPLPARGAFANSLRVIRLTFLRQSIAYGLTEIQYRA